MLFSLKRSKDKCYLVLWLLVSCGLILADMEWPAHILVPRGSSPRTNTFSRALESLARLLS